MQEATEKSHLAEQLADVDSKRARYDAAAKELLGDKQILARILKGAVAEFREMDVDKIVQCIEKDPIIGETEVFPGAIHGKNTESNLPVEGQVTYDILFDAIVPGENESVKIIINVEAQNTFYPGYPLEARAVYYVSRLISSQRYREFQGSDYGKLKKVYSIWICFDASQNAQNTITEYSIQPTNIYGNYGTKKKCDYISIVIVGMEKGLDEYKGNELLDMLTVTFSEQLTAAAKEDILCERHKIQKNIVRKERLGYMCNLSEGIYERGLQEGRIKTICESVVKGFMPVESALSMSGCTEDEFYGWMHKFYPDYKI